MRLIVIMSLVAGLLVGCAGGGSDLPNTAVPRTPLPEVEESVPEPTDAPPVEPTDIPEEVEEQPPAESPVPIVRMTLPPTWTPTLPPSETPLPTATQTPAAISTIVEPTTSNVCTQFNIDPFASDSEFRLGTAPTIAWEAVEGAALYRLFVFNEAEEQIHTQLVETLTYEIPADVFTARGLYGWSVEPLDALGIQMCLQRGEVLIAQ